jgi:uncharacterized protein YegJ (DUF2314 family)
MEKSFVAVLLAFFFAGAALSFGSASAEDRVISVPDTDSDMNAAIAAARSSLPEFFKELEHPKPGENNFALKVRIPYGTAGRAEHFWLVDIVRKDDGFVGTINNEPEFADQVKAGQRYEFKDSDISDWLFMRNGKMVGNETMRPLLKHMSKQDADSYRALYENP